MIRAYLAMAAVAVSFATAAPRAADASASCALSASPLVGHYVASKNLHGPGLWLDGGSALQSPAAAAVAARTTIAGTASGRFGNVVILQSPGSATVATHFYRSGSFASVQTITLPTCASPTQIAKAAGYVDRADVVYFAGIDRLQFASWKGTPLVAAVKHLYGRGGIVGGDVMGAILQGAFAYDPIPSTAISNPLAARFGVSSGAFGWPALERTIVATQFAEKDRFGTSVALLSLIRFKQLLAGTAPVYALGIDAGSSVVVGPDGMATVFSTQNSLGAYLVSAAGTPPLALGTPLMVEVELVHLARNGERFDLLHHRPAEAWFPVELSGKAKPPYDPGTYRE